MELKDLTRRMAHANRVLNRATQYRSLSPGGGKNRDRRIRIPPEMVKALKWTSDDPIELSVNAKDGTIVLRQINAAAHGLVRRNGIWIVQ